MESDIDTNSQVPGDPAQGAPAGLPEEADTKRGDYVPVFPHPHYHSYEIHNRELVALNTNLRQRAEDVALIANAIGAESLVDIGSNLGGFVFYMESMADRARLLGVDGDSRFVRECRKIAGILDSRARFELSDIMKLPAPSRKYDVMLLQNVYHYIYDKIGDHQTIFSQLAQHARSILWYNPMDSTDAVIPKHSMHNKETDWSRFTRREIFKSAIKAGFLHPIPLKLRFRGMGAVREHWLFVLDEGARLASQNLPLSSAVGEEIPGRPHFRQIHKVLLGDQRSYKVFLDPRYDQGHVIQRAAEIGFLDELVCGKLDFIVDDDGNVIGYSQPRGVEFNVATGILGLPRAKELHQRQVWRLLSRMLRYDLFYHDLGSHNFVFPVFRELPALIDLESVVFRASEGPALSIYRKTPDESEVNGAEKNLGLVFSDISISIGGRRPLDVLWECLERSSFLHGIGLSGLLADGARGR